MFRIIKIITYINYLHNMYNNPSRCIFAIYFEAYLNTYYLTLLLIWKEENLDVLIQQRKHLKMVP